VVALEGAAVLCRGDLAEAQEQVARDGPWMVEIDPELGPQAIGVWSFMIARELGNLAELRPGLLAALDSMPASAPVRAMLAEVCARTGQLAEARAHLSELGRDRFAAVHDDFMWLGVVSMCAATAALLGDRAQAETLHALLTPYADRIALVGLAGFDVPVAQTLGALATALDRPSEALDHFAAAIDVSRRVGAHLREAHALHQRGSTLVRLGRADEARSALREALDLADRCGATVLSRTVRDDLRRAGARPRRTRLAGVESLTDSERRVAQLAAAGLSNAEIAGTLVVARRTVETHLTSVYRKLEIASRDELGEAMARDGPLPGPGGASDGAAPA
jgi:DNA-binding NarL/FixJ family response regulator